ncbi:membrane-associated protein, putative [Bodo saltans]|uniref:Membrane-associated protein, putative n=1 Tax=Bodo saltans TaxID=75058 RepID=A0A0S4J4D8_BODSA|nr:membrane-associated protein, putative [Bodo saltans]|eukprot:CUG86253.1 membrane-associated protein, putative [Bodo saltans]
MRRFAPLVAKATPKTAARSFFYPGAGESGIWAASGYRMLQITWAFMFLTFFATYRIVFCRYSTKRQLVGDSTDLWEDDGTVLEGEEAIANLKIQHERIMPFMNAIQEKLDAAQ